MCFARVQNSSSVQFSLCRVNEALSETNNLNMVTRQLLINNIGAYCCCRQQPCELLVRFRDVWEKRALQVHNTTRSSAIADGARCVLSVEILPIATQQCRVETTCTTSPEQIEVIKLEGYSGAMCNKHVHSKTACPDFITFYAAWYRDLCVGHTLLNRPIEMCGPRKRGVLDGGVCIIMLPVAVVSPFLKIAIL